MRAEPIGSGNEPPLAVRRYEPGRFLVRSERPRCSNWYLVDRTEPEFPEGHCTCIDFATRIEPYLCRGEEPPLRESCKHTRKVEAELQHARSLCEAAGLPFSENIIPKI